MRYVPDWWQFLLLSLASFRVYRLIAEDTILDGPRAWVLGISGWKEGQPVPKSYREGLATFITCPWCAGFWIALAWWGAWMIEAHWTLVAAVPWGISTVVALAAKNLDETTEA